MINLPNSVHEYMTNSATRRAFDAVARFDATPSELAEFAWDELPDLARSGLALATLKHDYFSVMWDVMQKCWINHLRDKGLTPTVPGEKEYLPPHPDIAWQNGEMILTFTNNEAATGKTVYFGTEDSGNNDAHFYIACCVWDSPNNDWVTDLKIPGFQFNADAEWYYSESCGTIPTLGQNLSVDIAPLVAAGRGAVNFLTAL